MEIESKTTPARRSTIAYRLKLRAARKLLEDAGLAPVGERNEKAAVRRVLDVIRKAQDNGELPLLTEKQVEGLATKYAMDQGREPGDQLAALRLVAEIQGLVGKTAVVLHGRLSSSAEQALSDRELDRMLAEEERKLPPAIDVTPTRELKSGQTDKTLLAARQAPEAPRSAARTEDTTPPPAPRPLPSPECDA